MKLYAIQCKPLGLYNPPFHSENDLCAKYLVKRTLDVKDADLYIIQNPADLALYRIADYDEASGEVSANIECICDDLTTLAKEREVADIE